MHLYTGTNDAQHFRIEDVVQPENFSSWYKLCRSTAWILRAAVNFLAVIVRKKITRIQGEFLSTSELHNAEICLTQLA